MFMRPPEVYANPVNENERPATDCTEFVQPNVTFVPVICVITHCDPWLQTMFPTEDTKTFDPAGVMATCKVWGEVPDKGAVTIHWI